MSGVEAGMVTWSGAVPIGPTELEQAGFDKPSINPKLLGALADSDLSLQLVLYPEGYIATEFAIPYQTSPETTGQAALSEGPGQALARPEPPASAAKYHASIGWTRPRTGGIVTETRTVEPQYTGQPRGHVVIDPYAHSLELYAHETLVAHDQLPDGTEIGLTLTEQSSIGTRSCLKIRIPDGSGNPEARGLTIDLMSPIDPKSPGDEAKFTRIDVMGPRGIGELLLGRNLSIHDIGTTHASLASESDIKDTLAALSTVLGIDLTRPLDRRPTAKRVLESMANSDFSVLRALVFAEESATPVPAIKTTTPRSRGLRRLLGR